MTDWSKYIVDSTVPTEKANQALEPKDNESEWDKYKLDIKKKVQSNPSTTGSEVGGLSTTPDQGLPSGYQKILEQGTIPQNQFEQAALGQKPIDEEVVKYGEKLKLKPNEVSKLAEEYAIREVGEKNLPENRINEFNKNREEINKRYGFVSVNGELTFPEIDKSLPPEEYNKQVNIYNQKIDAYKSEISNLIKSSGLEETEQGLGIPQSDIDRFNAIYEDKYEQLLDISDVQYPQMTKEEMKSYIPKLDKMISDIDAKASLTLGKDVHIYGFGKEQKDLLLARRVLNKTKRIIESPDEEGLNSALSGLRRNDLTDFLTLGLTEAKGELKTANIVKKLNKGEDLTDEETLVLTARHLHDLIDANKGKTSSYNIGNAIAQMAPFIGQLYLTKGVGAVAVKGAAAAGKSVLKKEVVNVLKKYGIDDALKTIASASAQAPLTPMMWTRYAQERIGQLEVGEEGKLQQVEGTGSTRLNALAESYGTAVSSIFSEKIGDVMQKSFSATGRKIGENLGSTKAMQAINKFRKDAYWSGLGYEYLEEQVDAVGQAIASDDATIYDIFDKRGQIETLATLAIVGGAMKSMELPGYLKEKGYKKDFEKSQQLFTENIDEPTRKLIDSAINTNNMDEMSKALKDVDVTHLTPQQSKIAFDYVKDKVRYNSLYAASQAKPIEEEKTTEEVIKETIKEPVKEPAKKEPEPEAKGVITLTEKSPITEDDKGSLKIEGNNLFTRQINKDGKEFGKITVEESGDTWKVKDVYVDIERQGYGKEVYRQMNEMAQDEGKTIVSEVPKKNQFKKATYMWESLVNSGEAVKNEDGSYKMLPKKEVIDFANRIKAGEKMDSPEDLQFYENNKKSIESQLKTTEEPSNAKRVSETTGQVQEGGNVRSEGEGEGGQNIQRQPEAGEKASDEKGGLEQSTTPIKDEYQGRIDNLDDTNQIYDKTQLSIGDYIGVKPSSKGGGVMGFVKKIGPKNVTVETFYQKGHRDADGELLELKVAKTDIDSFYKPKVVQEIESVSQPKEASGQQEFEQLPQDKREAAITDEKFESAVTKGLEKGIEWLDEIDKQLSQFGKETLGVNLPIAVAQTGIRAAKVALQAGKTVSEVIDAAITAVRNSDWYKGLTSEDKRDAENKVRGLFTKETKIEEQPKPKTERVAAIKKESVPEEKREDFKPNKRTIAEEVQRGKDLVDRGEIVPANLVSEVNANPRALNSDEVAALVYYQAQLFNNYDEVSDNLEKAREEANDDDIIEYKRQLDIINIALNDYNEAALNTAYEQGLAFRMRQILMDSQYNLATQVRKYKELNNGVIPPNIKSKFEEYDKRLKELNGKIRKLEERKAKSDGDEVIEKIKNSSKRKGRKMGKDLIEEGFDELMQAIGGKAMAIGDKRPSAIAALSKIGLGLIDEGVATIENVISKIEDYVKSKNKDFNIDEYKDDIVKEINEMRGISYNEEGLIKIPHDLLRSYVEKGIDNINDLVSAIKKDFNLDITDRELRDAITNYGKTIDLNKEEIEVKLREMRRIGRLLSGLEDVQKEKKRPLRSGLQRDKLSDKERRMQKDLKEAMKDLPLTDEEISKAWRTSLDAVKSRLKNQIADLIHRIDTGEKTPQKKGIAYDEEANQLKEQRDLLQSILEKLEGKKEISDEQKVRMAIANVERMMDSYEERVRNKDFSPFKRATIPQTPELIDAKKKLADIKALYNQMKEDAGIVEAMRLQRIKSNLNKSIKEYERRLKDKDFSPKKREKPILDQEALRLEIERNKIKYLYETEMERVKIKNRPLPKKIWDTIIDVWNVPKSFLASLDFSAPLRQGAILSFSHPKFAAKALGEMFKHTISAKKAQEWVDMIRASDDYVIMKRSGLYLSEPTARLSAKEEQFMTNLAHRIPIWGKLVSATERAYVGYLNKLRVDVFLQGAEHLKDLGFDFQKNADKYKIYADFINNATGRGGLGFAEPVAKELNAMLFSPRLVASRINLLYPPKYIKMPKEVRKMVLRDMGIFVGTGMAILIIAAAAGADVEDDPRSSDFGKIKIGNLRFDIWAGFQQPIRSFVQLITGRKKNITTGRISKISKQEFPNKSRWSVLGNFVRSKMSPASGLIYDIVEGENMVGEEVTIKSIVESSLIPLYLNDVAEIYREEGIALTITGASASLFGVGVQHYSERDPVKRALRDGLTLDETLKRITTNEDLNVFTTPLLTKPNELTDRQINEIKKRYRIYKKYGMDNPDINFIISRGIKNEEKAQYLIDMKKDGKKFDINEYVRDKVVSSDLRSIYNKMKNGGNSSNEIPEGLPID